MIEFPKFFVLKDHQISKILNFEKSNFTFSKLLNFQNSTN